MAVYSLSGFQTGTCGLGMSGKMLGGLQLNDVSVMSAGLGADTAAD